MLTESFVASISSSVEVKGSSATVPVVKDAAIFSFNLNPHFAQTRVLKKSSTTQNALALSDSHVFAAQADKAVIHVYNREKGSQEATIPFPEKIAVVAVAGECGEYLVMGTESGRVMVWETCTGRLCTTPQSHLQAVTALTVDSTSRFFLTGSKDSNVLVWSLASILSLTPSNLSNSLGSGDPCSPIHTLSAHRSSITALVTGHSHPNSNIAISTSEDRTATIWHYTKGINLRTYLLGDVPRAIAIDAADRAFYAGYDDGSVQILDFYSFDSTSNSISNVVDEFDAIAPIQPAPHTRWRPPAATGTESKQTGIGTVLCLTTSYDSTRLLSGHASGRIGNWNVGRRQFLGDICTLPGAVTNLTMLPPTGFAFPDKRPLKVHAVTKPRLDLGNDAALEKYVFSAELTGEVEELTSSAFEHSQRDGRTKFEDALAHISFPEDMLWDGIRELESWNQTATSAKSNGKAVSSANAHPGVVDDAMQIDGAEDKDAFISLGVDEASGPKELSLQDQNKLLKRQIESLQRTQKETFKQMGDLRKERTALAMELKDRGRGK